MWVFFTIISAFFLGFYDVFKKSALNGNAVLPVLFLSSFAAAVLVSFPTVFSYLGYIDSSSIFHVPPLSLKEHLMVLIKTIFVVTSWTLSFFAIKNLPITIVAPIRSTSPFWILIGAILIYSEHLNVLQWSGLLTTLFFFYMFSTAGKREGIKFINNRYIWFTIIATIFAACSGLYDKYLVRQIDRTAMQVYFTFYQVVLFFPVVLIFWYPKRKKYTPFQFRWAIPMIGIFLLVADYLYFYAVQQPDALISVISALRRFSVLVTFVVGAILFKEKNLSRKGIYLVGILIGILLLILGK